MLPSLPRLAHRAFAERPADALQATLGRIERESARRNRLLAWLLVIAAAALGLQLVSLL